MFSPEDLNKIGQFIQGLIPEIKVDIKFDEFTLVKELNVGNTKNIYNAININIETKDGQNKRLSGVISESEKILPSTTPAKAKKSLIDIQKIPFSINRGLHLIINQSDWWNKGKDNSVVIEYIKLIPICKSKNNLKYVKTFIDKNRFGLQINECGEVYVKIWANANENPIMVTELPPEKSKLFKFEEYQSGDIIRFETFPKIVISLDKKVVEKAILVKYEPKNSKTEYFVFILGQD
ncbi:MULTISPECIES: hypothetical protein [unclassified Anabaena]|uniref:hypothetical protein n=1 Tax=unclassified Anabaena TaxID=2619674 RepID=UPI0014489767|nr:MULTISPECIES: hypothetical protein [unclassified Anabaena]MTJ07106.1 hypothetical protein [Anabaena sp. UHCC 0204]MTJ51978.1 hypothetical protein [Anabaena sp. UHCC 0253]